MWTHVGWYSLSNTESHCTLGYSATVEFNIIGLSPSQLAFTSVPPHAFQTTRRASELVLQFTLHFT